MEKQTIRHHIGKEAEGTYYGVPFTVPAGNFERVRVAYEYPRIALAPGRRPHLRSVVDLGLLDSGGRFLGWSGSAKSEVFTGPHGATDGYLTAEIKPGDWQILVGAYRIPDGGLDVSYSIMLTPAAPRWLKGDPHVHSNASDGRHDAMFLAKKALKAELDFIALSNHNNFAENLHLPALSGLTLLPAVEWTHYRGHMNFYGVAAPFDNSFIANCEEEMRALAGRAKSMGTLISANHPKCPLCPYLWESVDVFDMVEAWNGPMRKANMDAVAWWHGLLLSEGRAIPITGGSDFHRDGSPVRLARPTVHVFAQSRSPADILRAMARGHSFVTASPRGATLGLRCETAMMGDSARWHDGMKLSVSADRLPQGVSLKLVTSEGTAAAWKGGKHGTVAAELPVPDSWRFAYLVAVRRVFGREFIRAICNPVYFE